MEIANQARRKRARRWLWSLAALLMLTAGCVRQGGTGGSSPRREVKPEEIKPALSARAEVKSLQAAATLRITDRRHDFSLGVNVDLFCESSGKLRLKATRAMGSVEAFDAVVVGSDIACYVPRDKTLYQGKLSDLSQSGLDFRPEELMRHLLEPDQFLLARHWRTTKAAPIAGGPAEPVLEETGVKGKRYWRVRLDNAGQLASLEEHDPDGRPVFVKTYGNYRQLPGAKGVYPFFLKLAWPQEQREVEIRFKSAEGGVTVPEEAYALDVPERVRQKPLGQVRIEGD